MGHVKTDKAPSEDIELHDPLPLTVNVYRMKDTLHITARGLPEWVSF